MRHASLQRVHAYDRAECGSQLRVRSLHRLVGRKTLEGGVSLLCLASAFIKDTLLRELLLALEPRYGGREVLEREKKRAVLAWKKDRAVVALTFGTAA